VAQRHSWRRQGRGTCSEHAADISGVLTAPALFASGALGSLLTGQPVLKAGLRQMAFGLVAALVTFA
jgi:VIT1/CCC1 family predicted Fe2+/Mn2+ transporter